MPEWHAHVDESGGGLGGHGRRRPVLACVAGSPSPLSELAEKTQRLGLGPVPRAGPAGGEPHAGNMFRGRGGTPLGSMGMKRKMGVMRSVVGIVCACGGAVWGRHCRGKALERRPARAGVIRHASALLVERLGRFGQGRGEGTTMRVISDAMPKRRRLAMRGALARSGGLVVAGMGFVGSRLGAAAQAADMVACATNRRVGGDAGFRGVCGGMARKA